MPDDEPLDDARQVAMAAAAAAARVVETVARETRDQAAQHQAALQRRQDQQRAQETLQGLGLRYDSPEARTQRNAGRAAAGVPAEARQVRATSDLMNGTDPAAAGRPGMSRPASEFEQALAWAQRENQQALDAYSFDANYAETQSGQESARSGLIRSWKAATVEPATEASWDARREQRNAGREVAGVPQEAQAVQQTADLMRGADPAQAASVQPAARAAVDRTPPARQQQKVVARTR